MPGYFATTLSTAFGAKLRAVRRELPHHDGDVTPVIHQPRKLLHFQRARLEVFGPHEHDAGWQRLFGGLAVDVHERHARVAGDFRHARRSRRVGGVHDNRGGVLGREVLNLAELPARRLLARRRIADRSRETRRMVRHRGAENRQPVVIEVCHRHADDRPRGRRRSPAAGNADGDNHQRWRVPRADRSIAACILLTLASYQDSPMTISIGHNRRDDDSAFDDVLNIGVEADERESARHDAENDGANHSAADAPDAA